MEDQLTERPQATAAALSEAVAGYAAGVTLVAIADGRDDIALTVSAFCPVSLDPPLVLVALRAGSYPAEVLGRDDAPAGFAVTLLAADQRVLAGRFAAAGRPGARLLLDGVPQRRGPRSGALIPEGGLAALDCETSSLIPAGDHLLVIGRVTDIPYVGDSPHPLIRFRGRYPSVQANLT
jgi:flavin reductase (DIM6/NTAB) family NADH-FMN oxidoreductase RutF